MMAEVTADAKSSVALETRSDATQSPEPEAESENNHTEYDSLSKEVISLPEGSAETEHLGEIISEPESVAEPLASTESIIIPTILLLLLILGGIGLLNIRKRLHAKRNLKQKSSFTPRVSPTPTPLPDEKFLNAFDLEVLEYKEHFYNRTSDLVGLAAPALISILQAPLVLYLYPTLTKYMWPDHDEVPNVNDAIACFLMPAGLVYATVFGAAFSAASGKLSELQTKFVNEVSMIDQIFTLTLKLDIPTDTKMSICKAVKSEIIYLLLQIEGKEPDSFVNKPPVDVKGWCIAAALVQNTMNIQLHRQLVYLTRIYKTETILYRLC
ncbi:hypothetical protein EB796_007885 [Bugula neritina]|uniref:Uncharacterized protein n=1 Tax=Bugula neritina TaxID=10212 RepID=A0A7J7K857_BUGNE|nr:hypothetical protein EB796_007885 [Bugula neritina]